MPPALAISCLLVCAAPPDDGEPHRLRIGDEPPRLMLSHWITPPPRAVPGMRLGLERPVIVVHFWSTMDDAGLEQAPMLAQLMVAHPDDLVVIAVSNDDPGRLERFTSSEFPFPYYVARDADGDSTDAWLYDVDPFPWSFVIDRRGRIIWMGESGWALREIVGRVIAGTYDFAAARRGVENEQKIEQLEGELRKALQRGDEEALVAAADRIIAVDPTRIDGYDVKRLVLQRIAAPQHERRAFFETMRDAMRDSPAGLQRMLVWMWRNPSQAEREPDLMLQCAERMVALSGGEDPFALLELARIRHELGHLDAAVRQQAAAVAKIRMDLNGEFAAKLAYYRRLQEAARQRPPAAPQPASSQPESPSGELP
ncbi:MAG: hypothetical protein V3T70_03580 [Phycisphaerae bacterium]